MEIFSSPDIIDKLITLETALKEDTHE